MGLDREIRWLDPRGAVRTAVWSLLPLASGCASEDPLADALVDGCWGRNFDAYNSGDDEPDWEPFACSLPTVCQPIIIGDVDDLSPDAAARVDASARCMLEALRDGTPAVHLVSSSWGGGVYSDHIEYSVLNDGVVGSNVWAHDLSTGVTETYRPTRDDAFFDECLAQTEPAVNCLLGQAFPPLDREACIDAVPDCPD